MFATVVDIVPPALTFVGLAAALGAGLSTFFRKVAVSSLLASAFVAAAFILFARYISFDFSAYARDLIYEPLVRDHFIRKPGEGFMSALFHFGVPYLILILMRRLISDRNAKKA